MKRWVSSGISLMLACTGVRGAFAQTTTLQNPGFEDAGRTFSPAEAQPNANGFQGSGTLARAWNDNSDWSGADVSYSLDQVNPHGGQFAQRVDVRRTGAAVQLVQTTPVQKGHVYRFSVWLRGATSGRLGVAVRQAGAPYASYGETSVLLSPEWKRFSVLSRVTDDTDAFLMLRATEPLTFWVDDAALEDVTNAVSDQPAHKGNLLGGGSFEAGVPFGWNGRVEGDPGTVWRNLTLQSVATNDAPVGQKCGQLTIVADQAGSITSPVVPLRFGVPHTFSLWVRASKENTPVSFQLSGSDLNFNALAGTQWKRVSWTFTPPLLDYYRLNIYYPAQPGAGERTVSIDGAQLEEGTQPTAAYEAAAPFEMTLQAPRTGNIYFPGEVAIARVSFAPAAPAGSSVALSVEDVNGTTSFLPAQNAVDALRKLPTESVGSPTKGIIQLPFGEKQGIWKLRAQLQSATGENLSAPVELVWTRLPRPKMLANPANSFFGIHIPFSPQYIGLARDLGERWVRLHDTSMIGKWPVAEPTAGHFQFYDQEVSAAHAAGLQILGMLDGAPARYSTQPREPKEGGYWGIWNIPDKPEALPAWRNYVSTVAGHYKGFINDWEVWNEPWGQWWIASGNPNATPALYAQFLRAANEEAHRANPRANILGVDTYASSEDKWTKPVLALTGTSAFDALSFHDYSDALAGGSSSRVQNQADLLRSLQSAVGRPKPLWNTEGGPGNIGSFYAPETGGLPVSEQAAYIVRYDVSSMAAGVAHFFIYAIPSGTAMGDPQYRAVEHDFAPRPILAARAVLASLVDGRGTPKTLDMGPTLTAYSFTPTPDERAGKEVRVVWSRDANKPATFPLPRGFDLLDVWGNRLLPLEGRVTVTSEPVYLRAK